MEQKEIIANLENQVSEHCNYNSDLISGKVYTELFFSDGTGYEVTFTPTFTSAHWTKGSDDVNDMEIEIDLIERVNEDESSEVIYDKHVVYKVL